MRSIIRTVIGVLVAGVANVQADMHYVAQNGQAETPPYTNGWGSAASNIQDAVNAATTNDTVWVGAGHYTAPANAVVYMGTNVVCIDKPLTLRSSNSVPETTIIDGGGANRGVATWYPLNSATPFVIDGFTISNCCTTNKGGGILFDDAPDYSGKPCQVYNCVIQDNVATNDGGGIHAGTAVNSYLTLTVTNCVIRGNQALKGKGGGICKTDHGTLNITNCLIEGNTALSGGGVQISYSKALIDRCIIRGNRATTTANGTGGGGLQGYIIGTVATARWLRNCLICNNTAYYGGGLCLAGDPDVHIYNCTIVSNTANVGGGIYIADQWVGIQANNSVIYSNSSDIAKSGTALWSMVHCTNICTSSTNNLTAAGNTGNITNNPRFVNFAVQNFRLAPDSPCINTGTNQDWMIGAVDLDGNNRVNGRDPRIVDMGCYEFLSTKGSIFTIR